MKRKRKPALSTRLKEIRAKRKRAAALFRQEGLMEEVWEYVAGGGSPIALAEEEWKISYASLIDWIYADEIRKTRYEAALEARGEWWIQRVLQELETIALTDLRQAFEDDGRMKSMAELPASIARAIAGVEVFEEFEGSGDSRHQVGFTKKVKLWDKPGALKLLGQKLRMFVERVEHSGTLTLEQIVAAANKGQAPAQPEGPKP